MYLAGRISQENLNQSMSESYTATRDFLFLHYKFTKRNDSKYWRDVQQIPFPDTLMEKIDQLEQIKNKPIAPEQIEYFDLAFKPWELRSILCVLHGLEFFPKEAGKHRRHELIEMAKLKIDLESDLFTDNTLFIDRLAKV